jgi:peptidoglycan/LPS O-acetylase OafA/YrhL
MRPDLEVLPEIGSRLQYALRLKVIPGLDAIRAAAVSMVVFMHFGYLPTAFGELGVMTFFVLSGFLITRILLKEYLKTGTISLREFYRRRTLRIFPSFYICWLLETLLIVIHREHIRWWEPWASFFYLSDYARAIAGPTTIRHMVVAWSLAIEEQFYLLWPAVLLWILVSRRKASRAVALFIVAVWIHRAMLFAAFHVSYGYIYNAFDTRIDALMIGSLLAILTVDAAASPLIDDALAWAVKSPWLAVLPFAGILLTVVFDPSIKTIPWLSMTAFSLQPVFVAVLLIQAVCFGNFEWRWLGHNSLRFIARISYALYLYHFVVISEGERISFAGYSGEFLGFRVLDPAHHVRLLLRLIPALILPIISYYAVELPFMRLRDRKKRPLPTIDAEKVIA